MTEEYSESGAPIFRHTAAEPESVSSADPELIAAVEGHLTRFVGEPTQAWHEVISLYVHIDVHVVEPTDARPAYTLLTSGMSERPMAGPEGALYAELSMVLPPTW